MPSRRSSATTAGGADSDPALSAALAELALDLSRGGFNEVALAAWNQLRHAEQHATGTEEHAARVHGFLGLAHFFVVFSRLRLANAAGRRAPNDRREKDDHHEKDEAEKDDACSRRRPTASASNLFDKHVAHWLRMTWDFEETKDRRGLVLVSGSRTRCRVPLGGHGPRFRPRTCCVEA